MICHQGHFWTKTRCLFVKGYLKSNNIGLSEHIGAEESHVSLNHPCRDTHSVPFRGSFRLERNILQRKKIRGCFRERWNFSPLKWNKDWPGESFYFFALRFINVPVSEASIWEIPSFFSLFCVRLVGPQLLSWPLLWTAHLRGPVTLRIVQWNLLFICFSWDSF